MLSQALLVGEGLLRGDGGLGVGLSRHKWLQKR